MTTSCSYDFNSLFSLRSQAILPLHHTSAQALNLWSPSAQYNAHGQTQPFPFADYVRGIGSITTTKAINDIFEDMSWDAPAQDSWGTAEAQPELSPVADHKTDPVAAEEPTAGLTSEITVDPSSSVAAASPTTSEVRKSSLADLTNGDREAINAHLAKRLGPHKFLSRYIKQKDDAELADTVIDHAMNGHAAHTDMSEPDGAASVVGGSSSNLSTSASAIVIKNEAFQTAPDLETSNLLSGTTPTASVADGVGSTIQSTIPSSNPSPRPLRSLGPHHRLKALAMAQDIPLPQSPAPVAKSAIDTKPAIVQGSPPTTSAADDGNESDVSSLAYEAFKTELPSSSDKEKHIDLKAHTPSLNPRAVDYLPPRSTSPLTLSKNAISDSEAEYINNCCPVPSNWSIPTIIGSFTNVNVGEFTIGSIHKPLLNHYSQFFATAFTDDSEVKKEELVHVIEDPSYAVFREWVYGRSFAQAYDNIDLKTLIQLWRFGARIQAPLFTNTVADAIIRKTITADDLSAAADEIDALLKVVAVNSTFRLLISHCVILSGVQLNQDQVWPEPLLLSILLCLNMGRSTCAAIQMSSKDNPCIYHLHPHGTNCKTS
ncbi:hypothetical protein M436DRAFT_59702 [Aureobasidium namibiae CBS 147.97]|uniref:BTB domain-containing protein n=1 Tax=Aureobasidium namibiae CBS 147.97 TaxID=1043004 RepID=A0A074XT35_9PEZI